MSKAKRKTPKATIDAISAIVDEASVVTINGAELEVPVPDSVDASLFRSKFYALLEEMTGPDKELTSMAAVELGSRTGIMALRVCFPGVSDDKLVRLMAVSGGPEGQLTRVAFALCGLPMFWNQDNEKEDVAAGDGRSNDPT